MYIGSISALLHIVVSLVFSIRKWVGLSILLLLPSSVFAVDLNLPGYLWGRTEYRTSQNKDLGKTRVQLYVEQGVESKDWNHLTLYTALSTYDVQREAAENYYAIGIKNRTLFNKYFNTMIGVEYQSSDVVGSSTLSSLYRTVIYLNVYREWNQ